MLRLILVTPRTTPRQLAEKLLAKVDPDDLADVISVVSSILASRGR